MKQSKLIKKLELLLKKLNCRSYLHRFGPKKFRLIQHMFALLFMQVARFSFRRASDILEMLGFKVPTYSALCKSRKRIPLDLWNSLLQLTAGIGHKKVAIDSTGFSRVNPSYHYVKRIDRKKPVRNYIKQSSLFGVEKRKFLAIKVRGKPRHDIKDVKPLLGSYCRMQCLLGDTAYDANWLHEWCYNRKIQTQIKPRKNVRRGFYRKKQMKNYSDEEYHQRSLIEAGQGGEKRRYGGYTLAKHVRAIKAELYCKAIAFNLRLN
jgi:transposase